MSTPHSPAERAQYRSARWVTIGATIVCWGITCNVVAQGPLPGSERPNIIVILSDDVGYNEFGFASALNQRSTQFETPRLDALAQQSMALSSGYITGHSVCSPSRAGLLTGMYPSRFGYEDNISRGTTGAIDGLPAGQATIASHLKDLGYSTGAIGKWHVGSQDNVNRPQDVGFDEFYGFLGGDRSYFPYSSSGGFDTGLRRGDTFIESTWANEGNPSLYDPVRGRYLTDAFGEEAVDFVNRHADDEEPFFLYVAFNATHTPNHAKQQDYDHFAHIGDAVQRQLAAMSYAMDRSVGSIVDAVESNELSENTVIVFANDNGGRYPDHSNAPFWGHKGSMFEGGIRVPFLIHAPGLEAGVYDRPVSTLDLLPTFMSLAGGDLNELDTDGVDVLPYLEGESSGDPHEVLFWRGPNGRFAVRKGDWKLVRADANPFARLHNVVLDPSERTYVNSQQPAVLADLVRELTLWEAQLKKAQWGALGARNKNEFDHFVYRHEQGAAGNWSAAAAWLKAGTNTSVQMSGEDAYANAVLEFRTNDGGDYIATNDMLRATRYTFMANELRFTGNFAGAAAHQATINGNAVLMVKNLGGQLPRLRLDATAQAGASNFAFRIDNEIQLLDDLEITGNGTQSFTINGQIRDFYIPNQTTAVTPHGVAKTGASSVTLTGNNTFGGMLNLIGGKVKVDGPAAAINGASAIAIAAGTEFELASGLVAVQAVNNTAGGTFNFHGGTLKALNVLGDLVNDGGTFAPGASPALGTVSGNFTQDAGTLEIEIAGTTAGSQYDKLVVGDVASLNGSLQVKLINGFTPAFGQVFQILSAAGGIVGEFDDLLLPALAGNMHWSTRMTGNALSLIIGLPGDYNLDGSVDAADYTLWRDTYGQTVAIGTGADGNRDGQINQSDFSVWKSNFGALAVNASGTGSSAVPEPGACMLAAIGAALISMQRRTPFPVKLLAEC